MRKLLICTVAISLALFLITPQSFAESCECDLNGDGTCDGLDWLLFYPDWGRTDCPDRPAAPVPKTGQVTSYETGDDGDLQMGVTWPTPRLEDKGNGTVKDMLTGLIWLKDANCFGYIYWNEAMDASNNLATGQCGLSDDSVAGDWRLPNLRELHSLVDYGNYIPALPSGHPFTNVQSSSYYWSSTSLALYGYHAMSVDMSFGGVQSNDKGNEDYVWPVRGDND
jgi:hypothetical protein